MCVRRCLAAFWDRRRRREAFPLEPNRLGADRQQQEMHHRKIQGDAQIPRVMIQLSTTLNAAASNAETF